MGSWTHGGVGTFEMTIAYNYARHFPFDLDHYQNVVDQLSALFNVPQPQLRLGTLPGQTAKSLAERQDFFTEGYYDSKDSYIGIDPGTDDDFQEWAVLHEFAHHIHHIERHGWVGFGHGSAFYERLERVVRAYGYDLADVADKIAFETAYSWGALVKHLGHTLPNSFQFIFPVNRDILAENASMIREMLCERDSTLSPKQA